MAAHVKRLLRHVAPARRVYYSLEPRPIESLPFVVRDADIWHYWRIHTTGDYTLDCELGREYAAHYLQWLKDNPGEIGQGHLGCIARDINYKGAHTKGFWLAFFMFLEQQLGARAVQIDPYVIADAQSADEALIEADLRIQRIGG